MGELINYTVIKGDTLYGIARKYPIPNLTTKERVEDIYQANISLLAGRSTISSTTGNLLANEDLIYPGDILNIPPELPPPSPNPNPESDNKLSINFNYAIRGKIVNDNNNPLTGVKIQSSADGMTTLTDSSGGFIIEGTYDKDSTFTLNIFFSGYSQEFIIPFTRENIIKPNIGVIILTSNIISLENEIREELVIPDLQIKTIQLEKTDFEMAKQQAMNKLIVTLKTVLLPSILTLIARFGITKAKEMMGKKFKDMNAICPANLAELNDLIEKKNQLTRQLNNIYNFLNTVKVGVELTDKVLTVSQITLSVISNLFNVFPIAGFGAPDVSKPILPVIDKINEQLTKFKLISSTTLLVLTMLIEILSMILSYLSLLDSLIQGCAIEGALSQEEISDELLAATQKQSQQLSPVVTNVNGFKMGVIPVDGTTTNSLKRRKAIARNAQGVIMLEGEPSFSSNDQILIDELVYYIKQNDLKAE